MNKILEQIEKYLEEDEIVKALELLQICAIEQDDKELKHWSELELSGYFEKMSEGDALPTYRSVAGGYFDNFGRMLSITDPKFSFLAEYRLRYPISQLIDLSNQGHENIVIQDTELLNSINENLKVNVTCYKYSSSYLKNIISHVRLECKKYVVKLKKGQKNDIEEILKSSMFGSLHPKIKKASEKLFIDGHFRQAILDSYIVLVQEVKARSGSTKDGSSLMQSVFSKDNPILKVSDDQDEQLGFMWLYSGAIMGIRNPKAHKIIPQNCPHKTYEWLAFASVLLKVLDSAEVVLRGD